MQMRPHGLKNRLAGFTLIEMLVVLAIMAMLAGAARPMLEMSVKRAKEHELRMSLRTLRGAIDAYKKAAEAGHVKVPADESGYPPNLQVLVSGVVDAKTPDGKKQYFLRRLPRDPFAPATLEPAETWGLRAADSPPDEPRAGKDVFDVYSRSEGRALDGTRYRDW